MQLSYYTKISAWTTCIQGLWTYRERQWLAAEIVKLVRSQPQTVPSVKLWICKTIFVLQTVVWTVFQSIRSVRPAFILVLPVQCCSLTVLPASRMQLHLSISLVIPAKTPALILHTPTTLISDAHLAPTTVFSAPVQLCAYPAPTIPSSWILHAWAPVHLVW